MALLGNIFKKSQDSFLKEAQEIVLRINVLESEFEKLSSEALKAKTQELKEKLEAGASLADLLPVAFALIRESSKRTLGQRHFDVQLVGGIVLHAGKIAEMKTGEGKTLVATLPAYLNALEEKGVHVVTVNDYLAKRDAVWMGQIYYTLGMSVGCIVHDASYIYDPAFAQENAERDEARDTLGSFRVEDTYLRPVSRKEAYAADITYGTNNEFGFDFLRDNMVYDLSQQTQPRLRGQGGHHFAIIDEVDSILIDEARTPLIISAPDEESSSWYRDFAKITPQLKKDTDYEVDEKLKAVTITDAGINKVEGLLGVQNIYEERGMKYVRHLENALRAQALFQRDRDYVVRQGQVVIIDEFTGRLLPGRRYSAGLHQALEAKEGVQVQPESLTLASVTFQNYFRMYKKLAGMTGTAFTSEEEFYSVYGLEVKVVPTNKPMIRQDLSDRIYRTEQGKFRAVVREIKARHEKGQPLLVGTVSIQKNEYLGKLLQTEGIPHNILNAKHHEQEAQIIAQAGRLGAVTVATNMAGRGVDIVLGGNPPSEEEATKVKEMGGLHVIGTERHEARRIDNQLRGRAGRQGDPGSTQFFVSMEDDLMRIFGGERIKGLMEKLRMPEDESIENRILSNALESAQSKIEGFHFDARKHVLQYDDVLNKHRDALYRQRREILEKAEKGELREYIIHMAGEHGVSKDDYEKKERELGEENMRQAEKIVALRAIDSLWVGHLEEMEHLRDSVRLRAYGQRDPLVEYKTEGHRMFQQLLSAVEETIAKTLMQVQLAPQATPPIQQNVSYSSPANMSASAVGAAASVRPGRTSAAQKVGRNNPCPCGATHPDGRPMKYKHCHGKNP
ncbi:MAG TPA: preprotein translocase subunit SecA [Candidatus Wildermuthbacteria bacterium]|uniref:Protein translocase subunit SecA n=1 Tax=Candidatus Yanofskybacteria bacterium GW2011_GWC1_48_11 TaxID=1619027 RepID=A0A837IPQ5_9BACT|nr:MAG: Protein translocase subunit SecA [Candidatus Yanofskybacteria bacterium GW2011_GWC1_48_11]KKW04120.1 MAG: Protein translocase subunit SecA [Parcubacteria group bacterium GW2011_GWB1_49_12]KKW08395.1 MAG: Protein translocase subunit SecA [Parcubacteria group bacterium GW2011_GWA1_49_26]KKW14324.1 MAG: Protein translocase subunit SecA [Parcubacteria group bacterium GW2011_GWA2_50_10]OHA61168.1 MAG: preprotein translocase subunit SecA [Candidatus Wildermuthbacteria bacterium GWA1_49_26]OH